MGYTIYYTVHDWHSELWQKIWPSLIDDTRLIIEAADVLISGPTAGMDPRIDDPEPPLIDIDQGIDINGVWDDSHEPFILSEKERDHKRNWCKTLRKPYTAVVACILLRAHLLGPQSIKIGCDGGWDEPEWRQVCALYRCLWTDDVLTCPWQDENDDQNNEYKGPERTTEEGTPVVRCQISLSAVRTEQQMQPSPTNFVPSTVSSIRLDNICQWLAWCDEDVEHNSCRASPFQPKDLPGVQFRLVDIKGRCVAKAPGTAAFVALTYVWGGIDQFRLNRANQTAVMQTGALDAIWSRLSTTIRDAIVICEKLGERYLWTDTLCILQDSPRDMTVQIAWMRQIYGSAKCVLAAVSAATAEEGLLISSPEQQYALTSEHALTKLIDSSPWSKRAWCYQEKVFSHRMILFTSRGIYAQCQQGCYTAEGTQFTSKKRRRRLAKYNMCGGMLSIPKGNDYESFVSAVEYYSRRELTKPEDKKNAFEGIFRRYSKGMDGYKCSFFYGLPTFGFDQTFCWRALRHDPRDRNPFYPSWSWLGWNTAVSFDREMLTHAKTNQLLYRNDECYSSGPKVDWKLMHEVRQPTSRAEYWIPRGHHQSFGFPATTIGMAASQPALCAIQGSIAKLLIASDLAEWQGSQGRYSVFPIWCSQQMPGPPPYTDTYEQWCDRQALVHEMLATIPSMGKDGRLTSSPSRPRMTPDVDHPPLTSKVHANALEQSTRTRLNQNMSEHDYHEYCEAYIPLGSVWLDINWRKEQPKQCIMDFMAVAGERDAMFGDWIITMLMLLDEKDGKCFLGVHERVQVMDCSITLYVWVTAGAENVQIEIA